MTQTHPYSEAFAPFLGAPHRLEYVATVRNIRFIDDAVSSNVNACWYALDTMTTPTTLILDGVDTTLKDFSAIDDLILSKCEHVIVIGDSQALQHYSAMHYPVHAADTIDTAVRWAYQLSSEGSTVLYAPVSEQLSCQMDHAAAGQMFTSSVRAL